MEAAIEAEVKAEVKASFETTAKASVEASVEAAVEASVEAAVDDGLLDTIRMRLGLTRMFYILPTNSESIENISDTIVITRQSLHDKKQKLYGRMKHNLNDRILG